MPSFDLPPALAPALPRPPKDYDPRYMSQLVAAIEAQLRLLAQPRLIIVSGILTVDLPTSSAGLRSGEVYNDGGTLKVVP